MVTALGQPCRSQRPATWTTPSSGVALTVLAAAENMGRFNVEGNDGSAVVILTATIGTGWDNRLAQPTPALRSPWSSRAR